MSLSREIAAALDSAAGHYDPPLAVAAGDGPHHLTLHVAVAGPIGFAAAALEFRADGPQRSMDDLKAWGERVAAQVTYLMEPLRVLEVDPLGGEVELRSVAPTSRDGRRAFYEARLYRVGALRLARVVFDDATRTRRDEPFQMTREVLGRLADDLVATAG